MEIDFKHRLLMKIAAGEFDECNKDKEYASRPSYSLNYCFESKDGKKRVVIYYEAGPEIPDCASAVPEPDDGPEGVYLTVIDMERYEKIGIFYIEDQSSITLIPHYLDRWA